MWVAEITRGGGAVAIVDVDDTFDVASAIYAGIDVGRLLWVRCGGRRDVALRAADLLVRCPGFALIVLDTGETPPRLTLTAAFRLKLAVRRTDTAFVIVGQRRIAGPSATVAIGVVRDGLEWSGPGPRPTRLASVWTTLHLLRPHGAAHPRVSTGASSLPTGVASLRAGAIVWPYPVRWST